MLFLSLLLFVLCCFYLWPHFLENNERHHEKNAIQNKVTEELIRPGKVKEQSKKQVNTTVYKLYSIFSVHARTSLTEILDLEIYKHSLGFYELEVNWLEEDIVQKIPRKCFCSSPLRKSNPQHSISLVRYSNHWATRTQITERRLHQKVVGSKVPSRPQKRFLISISAVNSIQSHTTPQCNMSTIPTKTSM